MTTAQEDWEGPMRGDDKDKRFLVDYVSSDDEPRTGRARLGDSQDEWSPDDRPYMHRPIPAYRQREREEPRQEDDQTAAEAE